MAAKPNSRPVVTNYYKDTKGKKLLRVTTAKWPNRAVLRAVDHIQKDHYDAVVAEIIDTSSSNTLHALVVRRPGSSQIKVTLKREITELMG